MNEEYEANELNKQNCVSITMTSARERLVHTYSVCTIMFTRTHNLTHNLTHLILNLYIGSSVQKQADDLCKPPI